MSSGIAGRRVFTIQSELERGERLWTSPEELLDRFHLESVPSPSGVTHHVLWRR